VTFCQDECLPFAVATFGLGADQSTVRDNIKQGGGVDKSTIIAELRAHESELKAAGIEHLSLHGSCARGTAVRAMSDVDVIAEFTPGRRLSLLDMVAIENRLTEMLGVRVDLSPAKGLKEPVAARAAREAVVAF
jgi:predicted nucleotidyltransferase